MEHIEHKLPVEILEKSIRSGSEFGWRQEDFPQAVEAARALQLGIEGGLVQYVFEDGTCELYWLHYFTNELRKGENWAAYCNRTAKECLEMFNKIVRERDMDKEAVENFELARREAEAGTVLAEHRVFILSLEERRAEIPVVEAKKKSEGGQRRRHKDRK